MTKTTKYFEQAAEALNFKFTFEVFLKVLEANNLPNPVVAMVHDSFVVDYNILSEDMVKKCWRKAESVKWCDICYSEPATGEYLCSYYNVESGLEGFSVRHCEDHKTEADRKAGEGVHKIHYYYADELKKS